MTIILFNKPYGVLPQFTDREHGRATLAEYIPVPGVHPAGRLDRDSEGLLVLTDDGVINAAVTQPRRSLGKTYRVQVEGVPTAEALAALRAGVTLNDGATRPASAVVIDEPADLWPRDPPIRFRAAIPTSWIELTITEGRNRQVRRMTAAVGFPTLRLIRHAVGPWILDGLAPGEWRDLGLSRAAALALLRGSAGDGAGKAEGEGDAKRGRPPVRSTVRPSVRSTERSSVGPSAHPPGSGQRRR